MKIINFRSDLFQRNWARAFKNGSFRSQFSATIFILTIIASCVSWFFKYIEARQSYRINDAVLNAIPAIDLSLYTFLFIYSVILLSILNISSFPFQFLKGLQAYCFLLTMRFVCMYLVPLDTPPGMIILRDPFIGYFFYGKMTITKDLFFSGHVSTLFLLSLFNPVKPLKILFYILTFLTAIAVVAQHVHYSIDVIAAPVFASIAFWLAQRLPIKTTE